LKYLHENGCPWNEKCCKNASMKGQSEVLKYLCDNRCPCNKEYYYYDEFIDEESSDEWIKGMSDLTS